MLLDAERRCLAAGAGSRSASLARASKAPGLRSAWSSSSRGGERRRRGCPVVDHGGEQLLPVGEPGGRRVADRDGAQVFRGRGGQRLDLAERRGHVPRAAGAQGDVDIPRVARGQRGRALRLVRPVGGERANPLLHQGDLRDVGVEAEPHPGRADGRGEAEQLVVENHGEHPVEGVRVRRVDGLEDRLAQPLLALRGEQQPFDEVPALRPGGAEQRDDHVAAHHAGGVLAVADFQQCRQSSRRPPGRRGRSRRRAGRRSASGRTSSNSGGQAGSRPRSPAIPGRRRTGRPGSAAG